MTSLRLLFIISSLLIATTSSATSDCAKLEETIRSLMAQAGSETNTVPIYALEIEKLGAQAVPFIVKHMNDRTKLSPKMAVPVRNRSPGGFETYAWYHGAEEAVDMFSAVLTNITGRTFYYIYRGANERIRDQEVTAWRQWLNEEFLPANPGLCRP